MSIPKIKSAIEEGRCVFGLRETLKLKKSVEEVFVSSDSREETLERLKKNKINFSRTKSRGDLEKALGIRFKPEVVSILKSKPSGKK